MHTNAEIADAFDRLADLLEIEEANRLRIRRYRTAARVIREHSRNVAGLVKNGEDLSLLREIDTGLAEQIRAVVETGTPQLRPRGQRAPELEELMRGIDGLGRSKIDALCGALDINTIGELRDAIEGKAIRHLRGFGEKTEQAIARELDKHRP